MKVIQDILFPKSFYLLERDCGHIEMSKESKMNVATPIPLKEGMTLCEAIASHFSYTSRYGKTSFSVSYL